MTPGPGVGGVAWGAGARLDDRGVELRLVVAPDGNLPAADLARPAVGHREALLPTGRRDRRGPAIQRGVRLLALALSAGFTAAAIQVWRDDTARSPRRMFAFSLLYLFLIFCLLLLDHAGGVRI